MASDGYRGKISDGRWAMAVEGKIGKVDLSGRRIGTVTECLPPLHTLDSFYPFWDITDLTQWRYFSLTDPYAQGLFVGSKWV